MESFIKCILLSENAKLPTRGSPESAGLDLHSPKNYTLLPNSSYTIPLGLAVCLPPGTYGRLACRSSLAKLSIILLGGVIDPDYQGEVNVILHNCGTSVVNLSCGDRIVQLICEYFCPAIPVRCYEFDKKTKRGIEGFGSTGK